MIGDDELFLYVAEEREEREGAMVVRQISFKFHGRRYVRRPTIAAVTAAANVLPAGVLARRHRQLAEPGSARR